MAPVPTDLDVVPTSVSPRLRRAVHVFLLVFALTGVAHLELWPFTGFRLFSELRPSVREGWSIVAVDGAGDERAIDLHDLPVGYRNTSRQIPDLLEAGRPERDAVCHAWVVPLREAGADIESVRVYATRSSVRPDGPPPTRELAFECG